MTKCLYFIKTVYNYKNRYRFYKGVKYKIKNIDEKYYYTIKNTKFSKSHENKMFKVIECV